MKESQNKEKALSKKIQRLEDSLSKAYNDNTREKIWKEIEKLRVELNEERKNK
jgi:hypothetical protein